MREHIKNVAFAAALLCLVILACGCASEETRSYNEAKSENTVSAYEDFLKQYPESRYRDSAVSEIERIHFAEARDGDSIDSYLDFLSRYPESEFASEAKGLLAEKGTVIQLANKERVPLAGLSESQADGCWLEYRALPGAVPEDRPSLSRFALWYKREGFDEEASEVDEFSGDVGEVLGGAWTYELLRRGQQLSATVYDVYGRPTTTRMPRETVDITVRFAVISLSGSQASVLLLPESEIVTLVR